METLTFMSFTKWGAINLVNIYVKDFGCKLIKPPVEDKAGNWTYTISAPKFKDVK